MVKAMFTCPHCHKTVRDLKAHITRLHPDIEAEAGAEAEAETSAEAAGRLEVKPPAGGAGEAAGYHCIGCGQKLNKGQTPCPGCGEELAWESLESA
jgi:endogenous inhibitor of DNA gyrase (YacG/DUF329 family)